MWDLIYYIHICRRKNGDSWEIDRKEMIQFLELHYGTAWNFVYRKYLFIAFSILNAEFNAVIHFSPGQTFCCMYWTTPRTIVEGIDNSSVWLFYCGFIFLQCEVVYLHGDIWQNVCRSYSKMLRASKRRITVLNSALKMLKERMK